MLAAGMLTMPVLAPGGEASFGLTMASIMEFAASHAKRGHSGILSLDHGTWQKNSTATAALVGSCCG